jgi:hypothetical protein
MKLFRSRMSMSLNTSDLAAVAVVIHSWLDEHKAKQVRINDPSTEPVGIDDPFITVDFKGGLGAGTHKWDPLIFVSSRQFTICAEDGNAAAVDGEFSTVSAIRYTAFICVIPAILLAINRHYVAAAIVLIVVWPIAAILFAEAAMGSMQQSIGKAINQRLSDVPGPRGFEVMPLGEDDSTSR